MPAKINILSVGNLHGDASDYNNNNNNNNSNKDKNLYYAFVDVHGWYYNQVNLLTIEDKLNVMRIMGKLGS